MTASRKARWRWRCGARQRPRRCGSSCRTHAREGKAHLYRLRRSARGRVCANLAAIGSYPAKPEAVASARALGDWLLLPLLQSVQAEPIRRWAGLDAEHLQDAVGWGGLSVGESDAAGGSALRRTRARAASGEGCPSTRRSSTGFIRTLRPRSSPRRSRRRSSRAARSTRRSRRTPRRSAACARCRLKSRAFFRRSAA